MMQGTEKIAFVTGDRAEYDIQYPLIRMIADSGQFEPLIYVGGTHLVERFGATIKLIEADGFPIAARLDNLMASDDPVSRAKSAGIEIAAIADAVRNTRPDYICVMGDREDTLAAATVGVYARIPVIHIGGGDTADDGNADNPIRDAVTKLSHIHLAASHNSAERIASLGEERWRICNAGSLGIDRLAMVETISSNSLWSQLGVTAPDVPYVVMIQHPLLPEFEQARAQVIETMEALVALDVHVFVSRPNSDPGNSSMLAVIENFAARSPKIHLFRNLDRVHFVNLLRGAGAMVGNSSAGVIEAPYLKLPVVNVGRRQKGREHAENLVFVEHDREIIRGAVYDALFDTGRITAARNTTNPYGDGNAAAKCVAFIESLRDNRTRLLAKRQTSES